MPKASLDALRVRVVDIERVSPDDADGLVTRPIAGRLLALLYEEQTFGGPPDQETVVSSLVTRSEGAALGGDDELFAAALRNVRAETPENIDIMRVTKRCRIFFFRSENDGNVSGRILGLSDLVKSVEPLLPAGASKLADLSSGALVGVPTCDLLVVFFVATGDLLTGSANVVGNVRANYDESDPDRVSPWIYWVKGEHIEEMEYEMEDDEVASIDFPNELLPLLE